MLELAIRLGEGERVEIEIRDNGVGMSRETVDRLLQSVGGDAPQFGGKRHSTGLGTHNVFKRLHLFFDGEEQIEIDSAEGAGTAVRFTLPLRVGIS